MMRRLPILAGTLMVLAACGAAPPVDHAGTLVCADAGAPLALSRDGSVLWLGAAPGHMLVRTVTASGARYADSEGGSVWIKGDEARVERPGGRAAEICAIVR